MKFIYKRGVWTRGSKLPLNPSGVLRLRNFFVAFTFYYVYYFGNVSGNRSETRLINSLITRNLNSIDFLRATNKNIMRVFLGIFFRVISRPEPTSIFSNLDAFTAWGKKRSTVARRFSKALYGQLKFLRRYESNNNSWDHRSIFALNISRYDASVFRLLSVSMTY